MRSTHVWTTSIVFVFSRKWSHIFGFVSVSGRKWNFIFSAFPFSAENEQVIYGRSLSSSILFGFQRRFHYFFYSDSTQTSLSLATKTNVHKILKILFPLPIVIGMPCYRACVFYNSRNKNSQILRRFKMHCQYSMSLLDSISNTCCHLLGSSGLQSIDTGWSC